GRYARSSVACGAQGPADDVGRRDALAPDLRPGRPVAVPEVQVTHLPSAEEVPRLVDARTLEMPDRGVLARLFDRLRAEELLRLRERGHAVHEVPARMQPH